MRKNKDQKYVKSFGGKGPSLRMPALATLTFPLVVQLQGSHDECWAATYASPLTQDANIMKAKDGP